MSDAYERKLQTLLTNVDDTAHRLLTDEDWSKHRIFQTEGPEEYGRTFGNLIHDMPNVWSGKASRSAIKSKIADPKFEYSADHYYSRQRCGEEIARLIMSAFGQGRKPHKNEILKIIDKARKVHYVLKEENQALRKFMAAKMTWTQAYNAAGVELVDARDVFGTKGRRAKGWKEKMEKKYQNPLPKADKKVKSPKRRS